MLSTENKFMLSWRLYLGIIHIWLWPKSKEIWPITSFFIKKNNRLWPKMQKKPECDTLPPLANVICERFLICLFFFELLSLPQSAQRKVWYSHKWDRLQEVYSKLCQTSKMEIFLKIVHGLNSLTIFVRSSNLIHFCLQLLKNVLNIIFDFPPWAPWKLDFSNNMSSSCLLVFNFGTNFLTKLKKKPSHFCP